MVISTVNQVIYNGDGITTAWPFTFRIIDDTDIKLSIIDADGAETDVSADYYVDTVNSTVYYPGYAPGAEPPEEDQPPVLPAGKKLLIYRQLPVTQEKDLGEKWPFEVIELALDKLTMILQQIAGWWDRCLKISPVAEAEHPGFDMTFPIEAGKSFRVNAEGTGFEVSDDPGIAAEAAYEALERAEEAQAAAESAQAAAEAAAAATVLQAVWFDSVADMVAEDIPVDNTAGTKGYYSIGDGGNALYHIRAMDVSDVEDGGSIIFLDNGNVAELIPPQDNFWNVMLYGIRPNTGDNYLRIYTMIKNTVYKTGGTLYFPKGKYTTSYTLFIPENTTLTGDGADSEIYFDETDTAFGVCVSNAGSNVTICNIKISQKSTGVFHRGSQPGCIGIGGMAKEQAIEDPYSHTYHYGEAQNLTVENVWFDGFYPLQCEPGTYSVYNVVYRNLYCPDGCVSMESNTGEVNNVTVDNVVCDLFRIKANQTANGKYCNNINVSNVTCNTLYIDGANQEKDCCTIKNLVMTTNERHNDVLYYTNNAYSAMLRGNISFEDCHFASIDAENRGIDTNVGIQKFKNCSFDFAKQLLTRDGTFTDSWIVAENCSFKCPSASTVENSYLVGYGKNNIYSGKIINYLWGDIHADYYAMDKQVSESTHPNRLFIDGDNVRLSIYSYGDNGTMFASSNRLKHLPIAGHIPVQLWNTSNRVGTAINTYGAIATATSTFTVAESDIDVTLYNRALIDASLVMYRLPTPKEVFDTVQGNA